MIHTFVTFHVLPNKAEEFESVHRRLLELICAQPDCREAKVHRSLADALEYVVYGTWDGKEAWDRAHQTIDQFKSLFKSLPVEGHTLSRTSSFEPAYGVEPPHGSQDADPVAARDSREVCSTNFEVITCGHTWA